MQPINSIFKKFKIDLGRNNYLQQYVQRIKTFHIHNRWRTLKAGIKPLRILKI
jgi:hypothetical protein